MQGALNYGEAKTCEIMTPIEDTFSLTSDQRLNFDVMLDIFENGYSRIPVWDVKRENLIGLLYSKDLILLTPREEVPVVTVLSFFHREYIPVLDENDTLEKALRILNSEKVHFAAVRGVDDSNEDLDPVYRIIGCITLEDILEQILQMNVEDEHDIEIECKFPMIVLLVFYYWFSNVDLMFLQLLIPRKTVPKRSNAIRES